MPKRTPVVVTDYRPQVIAGSSSGGGGAQPLIVHDLDSSHSGRLPWARVNKAGSSLADLVTRDHALLVGVGTNTHAQIDAHIGTANIHVDHSAVSVTAGDGLTGGGTIAASRSLAVNSTVVRTTRTLTAGDGLSGGGDLGANRTFAVDGTVVRTSRTLTAGDGLSGGGDLGANRTFAVDGTVVRTSRTLTAGDGLTGGGDLGANRTFALTQPGTLSAGSASTASGNHTHAVTASADVGTTPGEALLKSTSQGGLILGSLGVKGSVNITDGGDLTVGNNILFVDVSLANVGIGWAPDPQFALDVNGPLRAQYLVGQLAMQLNGITSVWQFDGPDPSPTNTGDTRNHRGQQPTSENSVTFVDGKFGKAVQVPKSTTNLVPNPSFETDTLGWGSHTSGTAAGTWAQSTHCAFAGAQSIRVEKTAGATSDQYGIIHNNFSGRTIQVTSGLTYTFSAWVWVTASSGGTGSVRLNTGGAVQGVSATISGGPTAGWVRLSVSATATSTGLAFMRVFVFSADTMVFYVDAVQVEEGSYATAYCDGGMGTGHSWAGTAHATTSSRTAARLTYDGSRFVNPDRGTIMAWVRADALVNQMVFSTGTTWWLRARSTGDWDFMHNGVQANVAGSYTAGQWHHVALTWDGTTVTLYVDGVSVRTQSNGALTAGITTFDIGRYRVTPNQWWTGAIDNFAVLNRAMPTAEVRAVYLTGGPVFAVTSSFGFRATPRGLVWADDEGLWVRDTAGASVLGVYAGEAASKSWGGFTLAPGDIAFGTYGASGGGWVRFDDDGAAGKGLLSIGYGSTSVWEFADTEARLAGVLALGASGGIYQGSGTFASPTTGLKLWNDGGVGRLAGINGGVIQWEGATDGKLKAGAGAVELSINGIVATAGTIGGWTLGPSALTAGSGPTAVGVSTGSVAFYAGNDSPGSAPFRVTAAGALVATSATITGAITATSGAINGVLTIGTGGGIYQGSGTFASPTTGLKLWNSSGVGRLAGYNGGTLQWEGATDGKLKAGAGAVVMDANGVEATAGTIGGWTLGASEIAATNLRFVSGGANTARIEAGSTGFIGGINSPQTSGDVMFWANASHANRDNATFKVRADGGMEAASVHVPGVITAAIGLLQVHSFLSAGITSINGWLTLEETGSTPPTPTAGTQMRLYMKSDKLVIQYRDGGTTRYKYLDLTGTGVTWTHSTTAP